MKLPILSSQELCKFLEKEGFEAIRQKGSHKFYRHPDGRTDARRILQKTQIGQREGILLFNKQLW